MTARVLAIVPARAGSKRVPGKNLRVLGGKPLVAHAIEAAVGAGCCDVVAVSSDDPAVLAIARADPRVVALERPVAIAGDTSLAIEYVRHALEVLEGRATHTSPALRSTQFDVVVIVQPSSPLTTPADVRATVALLAASGADSAVSVMKLDHAIHPVKLKRLVGDKLEPFLEDERGRMASHELPELYVRNCAVYASRRSIIDAGDIIGADCRAYVMPRERSVDINDEIDFALCELLFSRGRAS